MRNNLGILQIDVNDEITLDDAFKSDTFTEITSQLSQENVEKILSACKKTKLILLSFSNIIGDGHGGVASFFVKLVEDSAYFYAGSTLYDVDADVVIPCGISIRLGGENSINFIC